MIVSDLLSFARTLEGQEIRTRTQRRPFLVEVDEDRLVYRFATGDSSALRQESRIALAETVEQFTHTRSLTPAHYQHFSRNAAYTLALIELYLSHDQ